jgi:hypothetical protein
MEYYLIGGLSLVNIFLWARNGYLDEKVKAAEARADRAERVAAHGKKVATVERKRTEGRTQRIEEAVSHAEEEDFSGFYDDDSN